MADHVWPALNLGLVVGLVYGCSGGGLRNISLGVIGGMIGALGAFVAVLLLPVPHGFISRAVSVILSAGAAFVLIRMAGGPSGADWGR